MDLYPRHSVVSYRNSTSNHNISGALGQLFGLYLIEILHQTTTDCPPAILAPMLYLIEILHQTTTLLLLVVLLLRCILSKFYIKPQPAVANIATANVVSYRNSTSNHNTKCAMKLFVVLYLIEILHQTTTPSPLLGVPPCCILSKFYIKPQLSRQKASCYRVVSYRNSTSNHNRPKLELRSPLVVSYRNSTSNHNKSAK